MINTNKIETTERMECSADTKLFFDDVYTNSTRTKKAQVETMQSGRSMIEMLGVLAIVGVLSVGGIAGYSKAMEKFKINKTIEQISHVIANIRTLYAQQTTYDGLDESTAIKMGIVPDSLTTLNSWPYITNVFGGPFEIHVGGRDNYSDNKAFFVGFRDLPKNVCLEIATKDWGDASSGLISVGNSTGPHMGSYLGCSGTSGGVGCAGGSVVPLPLTIKMLWKYVTIQDFYT